MEPKLELKHLAAYLPYKLKIEEYYEASFFELLPNNIEYCIENKCRPILRSLSDLAKEIEHNGEKFVPIVDLLKIKEATYYSKQKGSRYCEIETEQTPAVSRAWFKYMATIQIEVWITQLNTEEYWIVQQLLEYHFDVFGLIESGLAIDINTIN